MTRLYVQHRTRYQYEIPVQVSYNEARMTPQTDAQQVVLETALSVRPQGASVATYRDYWGTKVHTFDLHAAHEQLSGAETFEEFSDFLPQSALSEPGGELASAAAGIARGRTPHDAAHALFSWLREEMEYQPGHSQGSWDARTAFHARKGVCQDLSHVSIAALRSLGLPARYVSGYIHPDPEAAAATPVAGQSHAWLEWWDGR